MVSMVQNGWEAAQLTVVLVAWNLWLETLSLSHILDDLTWHCGLVERRTAGQDLPVIEYGLWESLTAGSGTKVGVETKRFHDRQVRLDGEERSTHTLLFGE